MVFHVLGTTAIAKATKKFPTPDWDPDFFIADWDMWVTGRFSLGKKQVTVFPWVPPSQNYHHDSMIMIIINYGYVINLGHA